MPIYDSNAPKAAADCHSANGLPKHATLLAITRHLGSPDSIFQEIHTGAWEVGNADTARIIATVDRSDTYHPLEKCFSFSDTTEKAAQTTIE